MTRGSSITNNTLYACGYNGYYNLSNSSNNTSNASTFQTVRYRNNSTFTNCDDGCKLIRDIIVLILVSRLYRYNSTFAARKYDNPGEWYLRCL